VFWISGLSRGAGLVELRRDVGEAHETEWAIALRKWAFHLAHFRYAPLSSRPHRRPESDGGHLLRLNPELHIHLLMTKPTSSNQLWFLDSFVTIRVSASEGEDGISVLDHRMPYGSSPTLHFHRTEDELFHVLEGEYRVRVRDQDQRLRAGDVVLAPKGAPHTYRVESATGGRCLTITVRGDFERFVRALGRPAERPELPAPGGPPSPGAFEALKAAAAKFGIELVGPPLK